MTYLCSQLLWQNLTPWSRGSTKIHNFLDILKNVEFIIDLEKFECWPTRISLKMYMPHRISQKILVLIQYVPKKTCSCCIDGNQQLQVFFGTNCINIVGLFLGTPFLHYNFLKLTLPANLPPWLICSKHLFYPWMIDPYQNKYRLRVRLCNRKTS